MKEDQVETKEIQVGFAVALVSRVVRSEDDKFFLSRLITTANDYVVTNNVCDKLTSSPVLCSGATHLVGLLFYLCHTSRSQKLLKERMMIVVVIVLFIASPAQKRI